MGVGRLAPPSTVPQINGHAYCRRGLDEADTSRLAMDPWIWLSLAALVAGLLIIITVARGSFSSKSKKRKLIPQQDSSVVMGIK